MGRTCDSECGCQLKSIDPPLPTGDFPAKHGCKFRSMFSPFPFPASPCGCCASKGGFCGNAETLLTSSSTVSAGKFCADAIELPECCRPCSKLIAKGAPRFLSLSVLRLVPLPLPPAFPLPDCNWSSASWSPMEATECTVPLMVPAFGRLPMVAGITRKTGHPALSAQPSLLLGGLGAWGGSGGRSCHTVLP